MTKRKLAVKPLKGSFREWRRAEGKHKPGERPLPDELFVTNLREADSKMLQDAMVGHKPIALSEQSWFLVVRTLADDTFVLIGTTTPTDMVDRARRREKASEQVPSHCSG